MCNFNRRFGERIFLLVYEIIKIYSEKFITNNSENKYKLSYTFIKIEPPLQEKKEKSLPKKSFETKKKATISDCLFKFNFYYFMKFQLHRH
jgi:hypothetical protein